MTLIAQPQQNVAVMSQEAIRQDNFEVSSSGAAAHAQAAVQAKYIMAMRRPRNLDTVRINLLQHCKRPRFAEVAKYHKPIGKGVDGPSIRFVEAALLAMGNIDTPCTTMFDDKFKRIISVSVVDLENNTSYSREITITKEVERKSIKHGQNYLRTRINSFGDTIYILEASDDDIATKEAALVSKTIRTLGLRIIPGDIVDEAMQEVESTLKSETARDPDAAKKKLVDAFAGVGVMPTDLVAYLGHDLGKLSETKIAQLRKIYASIKDGETSWNEVVSSSTTQSPSQESSDASSVTSKTLDKLKQKKLLSEQNEVQAESSFENGLTAQ